MCENLYFFNINVSLSHLATWSITIVFSILWEDLVESH